MKIAFVHPELGLGGAERLVVDAASVLRRRGHRPILFTSRHDPARCFEATRDGSIEVRVHGRALPVHVAGRLRAPSAIARTWLAARAAAAERPDAIVCDLVSHTVPALRALSAAPLAFYCHFPDRLLAPPAIGWRRIYRRPIDALEERGLARADRVLVNSAFTAAVFGEAFPRLPAPEVLHPGVDTTRFPAGAPPSAGHCVVAISRLVPEKQLALAIEAFAAMRPHLSAAAFAASTLVIAGGFDARLPECAATVAGLEGRARALGVHDRVTILRSPSDAEILALLSRARCVVYTPPREHFGYVPLEAMAASRPVIAPDSGGPAETVVDGATGFLRPSGGESFAEPLARLVADPDLADRMGRAGRARVEREFSLDAFGARLEAVLLELTGRQR